MQPESTPDGVAEDLENPVYDDFYDWITTGSAAPKDAPYGLLHDILPEADYRIDSRAPFLPTYTESSLVRDQVLVGNHSTISGLEAELTSLDCPVIVCCSRFLSGAGGGRHVKRPMIPASTWTQVGALSPQTYKGPRTPSLMASSGFIAQPLPLCVCVFPESLDLLTFLTDPSGHKEMRTGIVWVQSG